MASFYRTLPKYTHSFSIELILSYLRKPHIISTVLNKNWASATIQQLNKSILVAMTKLILINSSLGPHNWRLFLFNANTVLFALSVCDKLHSLNCIDTISAYERDTALRPWKVALKTVNLIIAFCRLPMMEKLEKAGGKHLKIHVI